VIPKSIDEALTGTVVRLGGYKNAMVDGTEVKVRMKLYVKGEHLLIAVNSWEGHHV
jgi:hypothetical protein